MTTPRKAIDNFHLPLLGVSLTICILGLFNLYSASSAGSAPYFMSQLAWMGLALAAGIFAVLIDYRIHERLAYFYFFLVVFLLLAVFFFPSAGGAKRWIPLVFFKLQPSELAKLAIVAVLARWFHDDARSRPYTLKQLRIPLALLGSCALLVLMEPDLGTSLLILAIGGTLILFVRVRWKSLALVLVVMILVSFPAWKFVLKDYQKQRILNLLEPEADIKGSGYHRRQSIIAIGSGETFGKGYQEGTQTQLKFLPEKHTDFIFSVWAEEHGFVGSFALLLLYFALFLFGLQISSSARERFGALLALGCTAILFWQMLINIGMVLGILPVVGMTLPFMSYGGTSLVVCAISVGLLLNVSMRRYMF